MGQCAKERIINKQIEKKKNASKSREMGEERRKNRVEQEGRIWSQSRRDMGNTLGRITIQDARIGAHRMTVACPDSPPSASQNQHQAGWSSIALLLGGSHAAVLVILSSASTFQGGSEKRPQSPHAARNMLHRQRVNAGVRLSKQWPGLWTIQGQSKRGCWTAVPLDARHHGRGFLQRNRWGTPGLLRFFLSRCFSLESCS
jgi:hypothetical protein